MDLGISGRTALVLGGAAGWAARSPYVSPQKARMSRRRVGLPMRWPPPPRGSRR